MTMNASKKNRSFTTSVGEAFFACVFALLLILSDTVLAVSVFVSAVLLLVVGLIILGILRIIIIKANFIPSPER